MNSKEKRAEIIELIDNIKEHSDRLAETPVMPLLEVSVILSKINKLHELAVVLKFLLAKEQNHEEEFVSDFLNPLKESSNSDSERKVEVEENDKEELSFEVSIEEETSEILLEDNEEYLEEDSNLNSDEIEEEKLIEEELIESELDVTFKESKMESLESEISDFKEFDGSDINEQYSQQEDNRLEGKFKKMAIDDILASIGLNERYLYANDLFDGEMEVFKSEVQIINDFNSLTEAIEYWEELKNKYNWEQENTLVQALQSLIERRFR
jgi:hypothetical protein